MGIGCEPFLFLKMSAPPTQINILWHFPGGTDMQLEIVLACGVLALLYGLWTIRSVLSLPAGTARMQEIAAAVQEGARAYLNRQYTTIAMVGVVIFILAFIFLSWQVAVGFLVGAILSGAAGYVGMYVSVRANVRTTEASRAGLAAGL